jgi:hypothetical protein
MFYNLFMILAIYKFNLVVSSLYCNNQYHAGFDICHNLHGLIIVEHVTRFDLGGRWAGRRDGVVVGCGVQNNPKVADVGADHEVSCLTIDSAVQPLSDRIQVASTLNSFWYKANVTFHLFYWILAFVEAKASSKAQSKGAWKLLVTCRTAWYIDGKG